MANTYKNIVITPNRGSSNDDPKIVFSGGDATTNTDVTLRVYTGSNGTLSFEGTAGQLFSITNDLSNSIFSVNDVSGIPSIDVNANGNISLAPYNGKVGIGTLSPIANLHVIGSANVTSNATFGNYVFVGTPAATANGLVDIRATSSTPGPALYIKNTWDTINDALDKGLVIDSVGGGQPYLFTIRSGGSPVVRYHNYTGATEFWTSGSMRATTYKFNVDTDGYIDSPADGTITIGTNNSERMRIDSSGRVGIGTSSPSSTLHVNGSAYFGNGTGSQQFDFVASGAIDGIRLYSLNNSYESGSVYPPSIGFYRSVTSPSALPRFRIRGYPNGDFDGFLFSSPNSSVNWIGGDVNGGILTKGDLNSNTTNNMVFFQQSYFLGTLVVGYDNSAASFPTGGIIRSGQKNGSTNVGGSDLTLQAGRGVGSGTPGDLIIQTGDIQASGSTLHPYTTKVIVKGNGNVGIGTTSPNALLNLASNLPKLTIQNISGTTNQTSLVLQNSGTPLITLGTDSGALASLTTYYGLTFNSQNSGYYAFQISGSEKVKIDATGNVGIGTSSPSSKLHVVGDFLLYPNSSNPTSRLRTRTVHSDGRWAIDMNANGTDSKLAIVYGAGIGLGTGDLQPGAMDAAIGLDGGSAFIPKLKIGGGFGGPANVSYLYITANNTNEWTTGSSYPNGNNYYQISTILESGAGAERAPLLISARTLAFSTNNTPTERMRIDANGNVGIGTTTPNGKLEIVASNVTSSNGISIVTPAADNASVRKGISITPTGGPNATYYGIYADVTGHSGNFGLYINNGDAYIKGYTQILSNAQIVGNRDSNFGTLRVGDTTSGYGAGLGGRITFWGDTVGQGSARNAFAGIRGVKENSSYLNLLGALIFETQTDNSTADGTTLTEKMRITSGGNVGIGTTSPTASSGTRFLEIAGPGGGVNDYGTLVLSNSSDSGTNLAGSLEFKASATTYAAIRTFISTGGGSGNGQLRFYTLKAGTLTHWASLDNSGQFGTNSLCVGGGSYGAEHDAIIIRETNTGAGANERIVFQDYLSNPLSAIKNIYPGGTNIGSLAFMTNAGSGLSEWMRIDANGNIGIGTTTPTAKLDANTDIIRIRTSKTPASASATGNQGDICWDSNYIYVCTAANTWVRANLSTW